MLAYRSGSNNRLDRFFPLVSIVLSALLSVLSLPSDARGQARPRDDDDVVRVSTDLLLFPIRVRDKRGQAVAGLTERDLSLKDEDHVTTGLHFLPGVDRVALVFALDQSGSLRDIISQQRDAAIALFARFGERSTIAIVRFAETSFVAASFTRNAAAARAAFDFSPAVNRHTAIFDAAESAVRMFDALSRIRAQRNIVILISDGLDNASKTKASTVIKAAIERGVSFYVIHLPLFAPRNGRLDVRPPANGFRQLGDKTGGKYFLVGNARSVLAPVKNFDLTPVFQAIEDDLKSQYLLGFYLGEAANDGRKHRFSLSLPAGLEYQVGGLGYSRTHAFFVEGAREALKVSK